MSESENEVTTSQAKRDEFVRKARAAIRLSQLTREAGTPRTDAAIEARDGDDLEALATRLGHLAFDLERELTAEGIRLADARKGAALVEKLQAALREIGEYKGEGRINAPWQDIVASLGAKARAALAAAKEK